MSELLTYIDDRLIGRCYWTAKGQAVSTIFSYTDEYLNDSSSFNIDPNLKLMTGAQPIIGGLPFAFSDTSPDRWGRRLIEKRYKLECRKGKSTPRTLTEIDFLLGVSDIVRQGDLRFKVTADGEYLHGSNDIPKLIALPKLMNAVTEESSGTNNQAIKYLLEAGSATLGGARPKASIIDNGELYIAKFPHSGDDWDVIGWEWVALELAKKVGINTPEHRLVKEGKKNILLVKRFDRNKGKRIGYISALTILGLRDAERADYLDIIYKIKTHSVKIVEDLHELFIRIALSILINNTDDHLRNHGFLRALSGYYLSPIFDINPNPDIDESRVTTVFGETNRQTSLNALMENSEEFALAKKEGKKIIANVKEALVSWKMLAKKAGISKTEIGLFQNVFE